MPEFNIGKSGKFVDAWKQAIADGKIDTDPYSVSPTDLSKLREAARETATTEDDDLVYYLEHNHNPDAPVTVKSGNASQELSFVGAEYQYGPVYLKITPQQVTEKNFEAFVEQRQAKLRDLPRMSDSEKAAYKAEETAMRQDFAVAAKRLEKEGSYHLADALFKRNDPSHATRSFELSDAMTKAWQEALQDGELRPDELAKLQRIAKKSKGDDDDKWVAFMQAHLGQKNVSYEMRVKVAGKENVVALNDGGAEVFIRPDQITKHSVDAYIRQQAKRPGRDGLDEAKQALDTLPADSIERLKLSDWIGVKQREFPSDKNVFGRKPKMNVID